MKYNILIIDDLEEVSERLCESFNECISNYNSKYFNSAIYYTIDCIDLEIASKDLINLINSNNINFLITDNGFFRRLSNYSDNIISCSTKNSKKFIDLLKLLDTKTISKIKNIFLYTYIPSSQNNNISQIKSDLLGFFPNGTIEIINTNEVIYTKAKNDLYSNVKWDNEIVEIGNKIEFYLYGYSLGNFIYNHTTNTIINKDYKAKKYYYFVLSITFFAVLFLSLSIMTNSLYDFLKGGFSENVPKILLFSFVIGIGQLLFILLLKPKWLFQIYEENEGS